MLWELSGDGENIDSVIYSKTIGGDGCDQDQYISARLDKGKERRQCGFCMSCLWPHILQ
jgi:hypothetical protein